MKNKQETRVWKRIWGLVLAVPVAVGLLAVPVGGIVEAACLQVDLGPEVEIAAGEAFTVPIRLVSDLGAEAIYSFEGRLAWDTDVFDINSSATELGVVLPSGWVLELDDPAHGVGVINFAAYSEDSLLTESDLSENEDVLVKFCFKREGGSGTTTDVTLSEFKFNEGSMCTEVTTTVTPVLLRTWGALKTLYD